MSVMTRGQRTLAILFGVEWPTILVLALCWLFFFLLAAFHSNLHPLIVVVLASLIGGWHSSFQHEAIHGHPTKSEKLNRLLASPSMALWLPLEDYRLSHLAHHVNENLTDPDRDPESYYVWQAKWEAAGGWRRNIMRLSNTLIGRLTIGALLMVSKCMVSYTAEMLKGNRRMWRFVLKHWAFSLPPAAIALFWFDLPLWQYILGFQFGTAFWMSLRSFLEHEAAEDVGRRTAMVFDNILPPTAWFTGFFSLLFLNNNLHAAHHFQPGLAWYQLPRFVHENKELLLDWNDGNQFSSYGEVAVRFGVKAKEPVVHPGWSD